MYKPWVHNRWVCITFIMRCSYAVDGARDSLSGRELGKRTMCPCVNVSALPSGRCSDSSAPLPQTQVRSQECYLCVPPHQGNKCLLLIVCVSMWLALVCQSSSCNCPSSVTRKRKNRRGKKDMFWSFTTSSAKKTGCLVVCSWNASRYYCHMVAERASTEISFIFCLLFPFSKTSMNFL